MTRSDGDKPDPPKLLRLETGQAGEEDPSGDLAEALELLQAKLQSPDGVGELAEWLGEVESAVTAIPGIAVSQTCDEIKELIHQLLSLNAQVQNLMRLKRLLS